MQELLRIHFYKNSIKKITLPNSHQSHKTKLFLKY